MVHYFFEGGDFMWPILFSLIFGLGFAIERFYSLMMSGIDSKNSLMILLKKLMVKVPKPLWPYVKQRLDLFPLYFMLVYQECAAD